ncbi:MAG: hypothetical protein FJ104_11830, partial [Deltaproteobacteria bacterium]|nr:hypothetical protein [Deltaproteobacteria bacterium]
PRVGIGRAIGPPSAALERAAAAERIFVVKDFKRMGIVVAATLVTLIAAGLLESTFLR